MSSSSETRPYIVLSLDGGGVRGLSALLILNEVMEGVEAELGRDPPLPWQLFDLIGGTSTGGLISIMLGRLRMSVKDCIQAYQSLARDIFQEKPRYWRFLQLAGESVYDHKKLEKAVQEMVAHHKGPTIMQDPHGADCCKTFVVATTQSYADAPPRLFRTYMGPDRADRCEIWEAARATSAAPTFFDPITVGTETFIDGALGQHNNPSEIAKAEAQAMWGTRSKRPVGLHLSLGTGSGDVVNISGHSGKILQACQRLVANCEVVHKRLATAYGQEYGTDASTNPYYRFSVDNGLQGMSLDEWARMDELASITKGYLARPKIADSIGSVIDLLTARSREILGKDEDVM